MRVIAGEFKGRPLKAPKGLATRPTTDRIRESLFSTLASVRGGFEGAMALDAFAGSGALGIEALSRGAVFTVFCEQNRSALQVLGENLSFVGPERYALVAGDVLKRSLPAPQPFDLVFFDPPYAYPAATVFQILERLGANGQLASGAFISYECAATDLAQGVQDLKTPLGLELECITQKTYGTTAIYIFKKG